MSVLGDFPIVGDLFGGSGDPSDALTDLLKDSGVTKLIMYGVVGLVSLEILFKILDKL